MVHVLPRRYFEQEMCENLPTRCASRDGGTDPIASEPTDGPIRTQCIRNPIWSGLTHGTSVAGRYDHLPSQYGIQYNTMQYNFIVSV